MGEWQPGDLALCVRGAPEFVGLRGNDRIPGPRTGMTYIVNGVREFPYFANATGLMLNGFSHWLHEENFRKVRPHEADEFDRETIALMNGVRVGEPA